MSKLIKGRPAQADDPLVEKVQELTLPTGIDPRIFDHLDDLEKEVVIGIANCQDERLPYSIKNDLRSLHKAKESLTDKYVAHIFYQLFEKYRPELVENFSWDGFVSGKAHAENHNRYVAFRDAAAGILRGLFQKGILAVIDFDETGDMHDHLFLRPLTYTIHPTYYRHLPEYDEDTVSELLHDLVQLVGNVTYHNDSDTQISDLGKPEDYELSTFGELPLLIIEKFEQAGFHNKGLQKQKQTIRTFLEDCYKQTVDGLVDDPMNVVEVGNLLQLFERHFPDFYQQQLERPELQFVIPKTIERLKAHTTLKPEDQQHITYLEQRFK